MTNIAPSDIIIYVKDKGITLREKSLIALSGNKVIAYGNECEHIQAGPAAGQEDITVLSPFKQNKITDFDCAVKLLKYLIQKARNNKRSFKRPVICIVLPEDITPVVQRVYEDVIYMASNTRHVYLIHEPLETVIRDLPTNTKLKNKLDIIIAFEQNPMDTIQETISDLLAFCDKNGISRETVIELLSKA